MYRVSEKELQSSRLWFTAQKWLPFRSGGVESANKLTSHVQLKRSGAWWYVANGSRMLTLRWVKYKGTFDRVFRIYKQRKDQTLELKILV